MNPTKMAEKQRFLARTASEHPDHRFTNLYDLLHWDYWMHTSAERVLARPGSQTDGVNGQTRRSSRPGRITLTCSGEGEWSRTRPVQARHLLRQSYRHVPRL